MRSPETLSTTSLVLPAVVKVTFVHVILVHLLYVLCFLVDLCVLFLVVMRVLR